jgi:hypothetical protein
VSEHLEPCPFCGAGETRVNESTHWTGLRLQVISARVRHWCVREEGQPSSVMEIAGKTREDAVRKWNQRIAAALNAQAGVVEALEDCIDSLEYVNRTHPESSGWGVRSERISKARDALAAIGGKQ